MGVVSRPRLSIVVPVRNDARRLALCLASIARNHAAPDDVELIVADNGSTDDSAAVALGAGARVVRLPDRNVASVRNAGARVATGGLLAFIDADHEIETGWIAAALDSLADEGVTAAGAPYITPERHSWVQRAYGGLRRRAARRCDADWLPSGNLVVRRSAFDAVGGFDETLDTCEDVDLCDRLRGAGGRLINDPRLRSVHHGDPASLAALFRGELWRGRDNLALAMRHRLRLRDLPSVAIPLVDIVSLVACLGGLVSASAIGLWISAAAILVVAALAAVRTRVMVTRLAPAPAGVIGLQAFAVAIVYDIARALALVVPASHDQRRRA